MSKSKKVVRDAGGNDWFCSGNDLMCRSKSGKVSRESGVERDFSDADLRKVVKMENERHYYPKKRSR